MSKDPAFLWYDGDAARDVSHMNRLERGAYFDIVQGQRKFGPLSLDQIRKILGRDFETVWGAVEVILEKKEDRFFISWLQDSLLRRKIHCEQQKQRVIQRWEKYHGNTDVIPGAYLKENENENENKGGVGGEKPRKERVVKSVSKLTLSQREEIFKNQVEVFTQYPPEMRTAFFNYWSEANPSGNRMRFEMQKTWDLKRRLEFWKNNERNMRSAPKPRPQFEFEKNTEGKYDDIETHLGG
jgi:hypothetical protein